jgi:hypothetical protein
VEHPRGFVTQYKYRDHLFDDSLQPAPGTVERLESMNLKEARMNRSGEVAIRYKRMIRRLIQDQTGYDLQTEESTYSGGSKVRSLLKAASLATMHTDHRQPVSALIAESISSRPYGIIKKRKDPHHNLTHYLPEVSLTGAKSLNLNEITKKDSNLEDPMGLLTNITGMNHITNESASAYASKIQETVNHQSQPKWKTADAVPRLFSEKDPGSGPYSYVIHPEVRIPPARRDFEPKVLHRPPENPKDRDFVKHIAGKKDVFYPQAELHGNLELPRSVSTGLKFQTNFNLRDPPPKPLGPSSTHAVATTVAPTRTGTAATLGVTKLKSAHSSLHPMANKTAQEWKQAAKRFQTPKEISAIPAYGREFEYEPLVLDGKRKIPRSVSAAKFSLNS